jgi:hypothetical protein
MFGLAERKGDEIWWEGIEEEVEEEEEEERSQELAELAELAEAGNRQLYR